MHPVGATADDGLMSPSKSRTRLLVALAAIVVTGGALLAFAAGYNGFINPSPAAAPATSGAVDSGTRYDTPGAVMDAMRANSVQCDGYTTIPVDQYDERAQQSAFCRTADGTELNVSVYANAEDARTSVQRINDDRQRAYGSVGTFGGNWAVHVAYGKRGWIGDVSRALNGSIVEIPPAK